MTDHLDVVFLDVGGPLYGVRWYYEALLSAIREAAPDADEAAFWAQYETCRRDQRGPFTRRLIGRFLSDEVHGRVVARCRELWTYPPEALQHDARDALGTLREVYRLGVLANQERWIRDVMGRDGIADFFEVWAISAEVGAEKPDPRIFRHALAAAGAPAARCAMVGDRLDNDVAAARGQGMRAVWLLRGEAPDDPTSEQIAATDGLAHTLEDVPAALEALRV